MDRREYDTDPAQFNSWRGVEERTYHIVGVQGLPVGRHEIECIVYVWVKRGGDGKRFRLTEAATVAVVEREQVTIGLVPDASLAESLRTSLSLRKDAVMYTAPDNSARPYWRIEVVADRPMPAPVAFEAFARDEHGDEPIGTFWCPEGSTRYGFKAVHPLYHMNELERLIVLRASTDVARQSVDLIEIWDGELTLGPIMTGRSDSQLVIDRPTPP